MSLERTEMKEMEEIINETNEDKEFFDLGQGLYSLLIDNPYENKWSRWRPIIYLSVLLFLILVTLFSSNFIFSVSVATVNVIISLFISIWVTIKYCTYNEYRNNNDAATQLVVEELIYIAPVLKEYEILEQGSNKSGYQQSSPEILESTNKSGYEQVIHTTSSNCNNCKRLNKLNKVICGVFCMDPEELRFSWCPKYIGILILFYALFCNGMYFGTIMAFQQPLCQYTWTNTLPWSEECEPGTYWMAYIIDAVPMYILYLIACSSSNLSVKSKDTKFKFSAAKRKILNSYKTMPVLNIEHGIERQINENIINKLKLSTPLNILYVFLWLVIFTAAFYAGTEFHPINTLDGVRSVACSFVMSLCLVILIHSFRKLVIIAKYPHIILKIFGEPLYCNNTKDIIGWWQLRHYYKVYDIPTRIGNFSFICGVLLSFTFAVVFVITFGIFGGYVDFGGSVVLISVFLAGIIIVILIVFDSLSTAFNLTKSQLAMFEKEKLRLKVLKNIDDDKRIELLNIIEIIIGNILHYDKPFTILSIPITSGTLLAIRGVFVSVGLVILTELVLNR